MFKNIINYSAIFIVFLGAFTLQNLISIDLNLAYLIYIVLFIYFFLYFEKLDIDIFIILIFVIISIFSLINIFFYNNNLTLFLKQIIGISFTYLVYNYLIKYNDYNIKKLFKVYLNIAFIIAFIGLFQEFSYLIGFVPGYDLSWLKSISRTGTFGNLIRINSLVGEPAGLALLLSPAFFVSVNSLLTKDYNLLYKHKSIIIILAMILTFSASGYLGIIFSLFLLFYNYGKFKNFLIGVLIVILIFSAMYNFIEPFKIRVDGSLSVVKGQRELETAGLSTFALFSNALVAFESFVNNPVFGSGLGSHEISYHKYINEVINVNSINMFLNTKDANSLFLRIVSETGFFGIFLLLYFILKNNIKRNRDNTNFLWIINNSILSLFFIKLLRSGHYFGGGFLFFVLLYYYSNKVYVKDS